MIVEISSRYILNTANITFISKDSNGMLVVYFDGDNPVHLNKDESSRLMFALGSELQPRATLKGGN